jgi:hypothetical protein
MRIDVVDRQGGPLRTVVESPLEDRTSGGKTIDSFALFGGKVYWITRDTYAGDTGTIKSYDLNSGAVSDVASGPMRNVRTTAAGLSWEVAWDQNGGTRAELKIPDALAARCRRGARHRQGPVDARHRRHRIRVVR